MSWCLSSVINVSKCQPNQNEVVHFHKLPWNEREIISMLYLEIDITTSIKEYHFMDTLK